MPPFPGQPVATLLTQTLVQGNDPAFTRPTKFVGPVYSQDEAARLGQTMGWCIAQDGPAFRRVVPSPEPTGIVELSTIQLLVVCTGDGGSPVTQDEHGALYGVEAVIDKDLASAFLATALRADCLLLLTDVDGVSTDWGTPAARRLRRATLTQLQGSTFARGSMGPKVEAACRFVSAGGTMAAIGALAAAPALLQGNAGTIVVPHADALCRDPGKRDERSAVCGTRTLAHRRRQAAKMGLGTPVPHNSRWPGGTRCPVTGHLVVERDGACASVRGQTL